jgi:hypothetical protein
VDDRDFVNALRREGAVSLNFLDRDPRGQNSTLSYHPALRTATINALPRRSNLVCFLLSVFYFDTLAFFTYTSTFVRGIFALS